MLRMIDDVPVMEDNDGDLSCSFDSWLRAEKGQVWEGIYNDMLVHDADEVTIDDLKDQYLEEFYDWCEENDITGFEV